MSAFARAYSRARQLGLPSIYFADGEWHVAASGYADTALVEAAKDFARGLT